MPKVSIVLPTYNGERYIRESLDSIVSQTYEDWELIIVNDCSTDDTFNIVSSYVARDNRIHVINNIENRKLPESLNIGFRAAVGTYFTWTSDDNLYEKDAIFQMSTFLDEHSNIPMVVGNMSVIGENGEALSQWERFQENRLCAYDNVGACFMYRRSVMQEVGEYDSTRFLVEDYDYWLRIYQHYGRIGHLDQMLYHYRWHGESLTLTKSKDIKRQLSRLRLNHLDFILDHLKTEPQLICQVYYEFCDDGFMTKELSVRFYELMPILKMDVGISQGKDLIVYGAGKVGDQAYKRFGGRIAYYADRDIQKAGDWKNGKKILSIDEMVALRGKYQIVVAVGKEKIYEILVQMKEMGIEQVGTLYTNHSVLV